MVYYGYWLESRKMLVPKLSVWFETRKLKTKGGFKWSKKLVSS